MTGNALVSEYKQNGIEIARIEAEDKVKGGILQENRYKLMQEIYKREDQIRDDTNKIESDHIDEVETLRQDTENQIEPHHQQRVSVKRIIEFLEVQERGKDIEMSCPGRTIEGRYKEWQEWIHNDDYLKIRLLISENDKPVNKYTVSTVMTCVFSDPLIKLPDMWGGLDHTSVKTIEDARAFIARRKDKLHLDIIEKVAALEVEYLDVIAKYKLSDFEELFEYRCSSCRATFQRVIPDSHDTEVTVGWRSETPTHEIKPCVPEYGFYRSLIG